MTADRLADHFGAIAVLLLDLLIEEGEHFIGQPDGHEGCLVLLDCAALVFRLHGSGCLLGVILSLIQ